MKKKKYITGILSAVTSMEWIDFYASLEISGTFSG
jgi:hypothetical protein